MPSGISPQAPGEVIAAFLLKLKQFYPALHTLVKLYTAAGVGVWLILLVLPARNPWWRWTGWFVLAGSAVSFLTIQYLPVIEYLVSRGAGR